jgi:hypothetical protein
MKPTPEVCTVSNDDTTQLTSAVDGALRMMDLADVMGCPCV